MDIGLEAAQALSLLEEVSTEGVEALAMACISVLLGRASEEETLVSPVFEALDVHLIKRAYSALACALLEAAKRNFSPSDLASFLQSDCALPEDKARILSASFGDAKEDLRSLLALTGSHSSIPRLLGVDTKLEYCVSSSDDRSLRGFLYRISLKTQGGGEDETEFACSVEQMQDLISRLKDACKSVERAIET